MDKEFDKLFSAAAYGHSMASVWSDFVHMLPIAATTNSIVKTPKWPS